MSPLQPHVIVLFGATGDLARRKLLPGLLPPRPGRPAARVPHRRHVARRPRRRGLPQLRPRRARRVRHVTASTREHWDDFERHASPTSAQSAGPDALAEAVAAAEAELGGEPPAPALPERPAEGRAATSCGCWARPISSSAPASSWRSRSAPTCASVGGAQRLAARGLRRGADLPHRPLPRQGGGAQHPRLPLRQRPVRADLEPRPHRPRADRRARDAGARHPRSPSTRRPAPSATWSSPTCSRSSRSWRWSRRPRSSRAAISEEKNKVFRSMRPIEPARRRARPVHRLPRRAGRAPALRHRDLHRPALRDRQLALGRRAVLPAHRQAHGRGRPHHLHRLPGAAQEHVPRRLRASARTAPTTSRSTSPTRRSCRCRSTASGPARA